MLEVVGQQRLADIFYKIYKDGRLVNSYLLKGPDGIGKRDFALFMAGIILCRENRACGICSSCKKIESNNHPDLILFSKGNDTILVKDIEEIIDRINVKPYEGDKKVVIIENIENMRVEAQNKFLKTLEEPSDDTIIILTANHLNTVLETIISRCQIFTLQRAQNEDIEKYLIRKGVNEVKARAISKLSDGILGNAFKFLNKDYVELREQTIDIATKMHKYDGYELLELVNFFVDKKDSIVDILDILAYWYRDILMYKIMLNKEVLINEDYSDIIINESKLLSLNKIYKIIDNISEAKKQLNFNANFQLTFEVMLLNIQED
ncbi:DNA polymerase III subunit delta' [Caloramator mitchellensis]|uniref:DNA polymerase III subunit delta' n=1 Tax=Caloramator mitchellensis TaxID=908809 RepID=A0A0R3JTB6_CALMK|nr:DNA polymerase III subunit delta' [Caloramator mitchellensis]KRQ86768.1 DNA polymerase III subunit delta' [Caloramator mitchellensis]